MNFFPRSKAVLLNCKEYSKFLDSLKNEIYDSVSLGWGLRACISSKLRVIQMWSEGHTLNSKTLENIRDQSPCAILRYYISQVVST